MIKVNTDAQLICTKSTSLRGVNYYTLELLKAMLRRGTYSHSITFTDFGRELGNLDNIKINLGDDIHRLDKIYECSSMSFATTKEVLRTGNVSLYGRKTYEEIYGVESDIYFFPHSLQFSPNVSSHSKVVTVHDMIPLMHEFQKILDKQTIEMFTNAIRWIKEDINVSIIADSDSTRKDLMKYANIAEERIKVIYLGYSKDKYYPDLDAKVLDKYGISKPYILYVGALDPRKGIDVLIDAIPLIKDNPYVSFVLAGGEMKDYNVRKLLRDNGVADKCILTGYVSDREKRVLMSMADAFVFPSKYEGFGLPVLEAMACGVPVITSYNSSLPEVGGDDAIYFETGNKEELASKIDMLIYDENMKKEYKRRGLARCKEFSWDKAAAETEHIFKKVYDER